MFAAKNVANKQGGRTHLALVLAHSANRQSRSAFHLALSKSFAAFKRAGSIDTSAFAVGRLSGGRNLNS
jgi:hypothetical protein